MGRARAALARCSGRAGPPRVVCTLTLTEARCMRASWPTSRPDHRPQSGLARGARPPLTWLRSASRFERAGRQTGWISSQYDHVASLKRYLSREPPSRRAVFRSSEHVSRARLRRLREGARLNGKSHDCSDWRAALPDGPCVRCAPSCVMPLRAPPVYLYTVCKRYPVPDFGPPRPGPTRGRLTIYCTVLLSVN